MDRLKLEWHVTAALEAMAARLSCTPEQLIAFGVKEDLEAFGEAVAGGEWSDATPVREVEGLWRKLR